jgi:WD40 repeat protein
MHMGNLARSVGRVGTRVLACGLLALGLGLRTGPAAAGTPENRIDCYGDPLPPGAVARLGTVRFLPCSTAWAVALSPDGRTVATGTISGSERNIVELWDAATGARIGTIADGTENIFCLAWSPDGRQLAVAHANRVEIFDAQTHNSLGELEQAAKVHASGYWSLRWSPDGRRLAAVLRSTVAVWDAATRKLVQTAANEHTVRGVAFSQDGRLLAVCGDALLETRRTDDFKVQMKAGGASAEVQSVAFSPDGKTLAGGVKLASSPDKKSDHPGSCVRFWDACTGKVRGETTAFNGPPSEVTYLPDGKTVVAVAAWHAVHGWSTATLKEQWTLSSVGYIGWQFAVSADGRTMATAHRRVALWDLATGRQRQSWATHSQNVFSAAFTADGASILSTGGEGIRCWEAASGRLLRCLPGTESDVFSTLAISHDCRTVAAGKSRDICLWEWPSWKALGDLSGHKEAAMGNPVTSLDFAPGDAVLISGGGDQSVRFWDVATRRATRSLELPQCVARVKFSPDGKVVAVGSFGEVVLLEAASGKRLDAIPDSQCMFFGALDFLPAGPCLVVPKFRYAGFGNPQPEVWKRPTAIRCWDYRQKKELWVSEFLPLLTVIAVSHSGRLVATGGLAADDSICVWSARTGRRLAEFRGQSEVRAITCSPDDSRLLTGSQDGTLLLWQAPPAPDD